MPKLLDVCRHVRSKNAGPFWITVDLFFKNADCYAQYVDSHALQKETIARVFGIDPSAVKRFRVPDLNVLKLSFPRKVPQGGYLERDMHGGQQYVRLLPLDL